MATQRETVSLPRLKGEGGLRGIYPSDVQSSSASSLTSSRMRCCVSVYCQCSAWRTEAFIGDFVAAWRCRRMLVRLISPPLCGAQRRPHGGWRVRWKDRVEELS